ncbi:MAG: universal stress protein [Candidatus Dormibacteraeota bacterium]|nr:universal stress protein [Candidatus Dormibacteraeota bacterium]
MTGQGGTTFTRIVAAIDLVPESSGSVLRAARELAAAMRSTVLVAHIQESEHPAVVATAPRAGLRPAPLAADGELGEAGRAVEHAVSEMRAAGVAAEGRVLPGAGSTAKELLTVASSFGATLIIVGDHGGRVADVLLGSVAHKLVRSAPCPVLVVR